MSSPYKKLEQPLDDLAMVCRGCLVASGEMKNLFEWGLDDDFYQCTNVKLQQSESLSTLICMECEESLQSWRQFREKCWSSDHLLKSNTEKKHEELPQETTNQENTVSSTLFDKNLIYSIVAPNMEAKIYLTCPYCISKFIKQKDLMIHLVKSHQISDKIVIELQYYCAIENCPFNLNSGKNKHFQGRKFLNQHINKVHATKIFKCDVCNNSFPTVTMFKSHFKNCNVTYLCQICDSKYNSNEKLLVHLMRRHPELHKQYKKERKAMKRQSNTITESKRSKIENDRLNEYIYDSPKRSFATQTRPEENIKNDITLPSWHLKTDNFETKTDEISTQTVFEDLLSLKSQNSEDESIFFSETVSLSDIQTQTFPIEFGLSRSNKETLTSGTQSPDLSIKETQTCFCLYDSPKINYRLFDSVSSSPCSLNLISSETQTQDIRTAVKSDVLLSFNSAETQTNFDDNKDTF